jgi:hypothetical protein
MSIENVIKHIIAHHNQVGDDNHHRYWHEKLEDCDGDRVHQIVKQMDHSQHHIGDCYRQTGMRVDLNRESHEATAILKVMNFIMGGLTKDEEKDWGKDDRTVEMDEKLFFEQQTPDCEIVDEFESELLQYKQIYNTSGKKSRHLETMELLEEVNIKAIAVSILAETNGSVKMAKDILSMAGMKIIKQMNIGELKHLRGDLQSISTQTDPDVRTRH